ncbi:hypothetical protein HN385_06945 [archaeon]|jgi:ssDNA-binding replication factor A large subunit|nr:hypothetical protein [archaeon]MBT3451010.1 hypothetical protein [archaeon]MBT6868570.1 hypothetical protein [archaeon]MBT7193102.1 hypothetical protein [archaeon]MBT7380419.1 hypothetical protein [archaeon]
MLKIPLKEIKEKLLSSGKISEEDFNARIKAKINELSGLISEEGAAHIIANELEVELVSSENKKLTVKDIYSGMRNVETIVKVIQKYEVREFNKGDNKGKVCSILAGDETGSLRIVFWNDQVDLISNLKESDILHIQDSYVKEGFNGRKELHLGKLGHININPSGVSIGEVRQTNTFERKSIQDLQGGENSAEIMGTIVQVFDPRFFHVCPECSRRVVESGESYTCAEHNEVTPNLSYVLNLVLDDGTSNIRAVFWKDQSNKLLDKTESDFGNFKDNIGSFEDVKNDLLGEQFILKGRVKKNEMFDRLEFSVSFVEKANPDKEIARVEEVV